MKYKMILAALLIFLLFAATACSQSPAEEKAVTAQYAELLWPEDGIASLLPRPQSEHGAIELLNDRALVVYIGETEKAAFQTYVEQCWNNGFSCSYHQGDDYFYADNADGCHIAVTRESGNVMRIRLDVPPQQTQTTGNLTASEETSDRQTPRTNEHSEEADYILNTNTMKFHLPDCESAQSIKDSNREAFHGTRDELLAEGYQPCSRCNP